MANETSPFTDMIADLYDRIERLEDATGLSAPRLEHEAAHKELREINKSLRRLTDGLLTKGRRSQR